MQGQWIDRYPKLKEFYKARKYGEPAGFGKVPAILIIDFGLAWTDKTGESPFGADLDEAVANTVRILNVARKMKPRPPIIFTIMTYNAAFTDVSPMMLKKIPAMKAVCVEGSKWDALDPRVERWPEEPVLVKKKGSAFWGTPLAEILIGHHVDTVIITGCTTDSCVRATAMHSFHHGYYTIIPHDAVGSRDSEAAGWALLDMSLRYGDVVDTEDVIRYLGSLQSQGT